ncbi:MAG: hypothetical protein FWC22_03440 [Treponema sp.]|nr:hypothetical protein [Treponema sp.]
MQINEYFIVFPEGDIQEIQGRLPFNSLVDMNGNILYPPLPTSRMIAFKVKGIKTEERTGLTEVYHFLDLVSAVELEEYINEN